MADVFLSYGRADRDVVSRLAAAIEAAGHSVWWDRLIDGGAEFSVDIESQLDAARVVIVVWSASSRNSRWVRDEASVAADTGKLVPVSLDGEPAPIGFRQIQSVDLQGWSGDGGSQQVADLLRIVAARVSGQAPLHSSVRPGQVGRPPRRSFVALFTAIAVLSLAAVVGYVVLRGSEPGSVATAPAVIAKSIAVLPFTSLSADADDNFLALALHDEVLAQLSKIADMRVISRTSVMRYADGSKSIPEIGAELGVPLVMEGAVSRIGERIRVNMKLYDAAREQLVWEDSADERFSADAMYSIQSRITRAVAAELGTTLTRAESAAVEERSTRDTEAYSAYLKGRLLARYAENTEAGHAEAIAYLDEAIARDPAFAAAYAEKSNAHLALYWSGAERSANLAAGRAALDRAAVLAPDAIETLVAQGFFQYRVFLDYQRAEALLSRAVAKAPGNAEAWAGLAAVKRRSGRFGEAAHDFEKSLDLNPMQSGVAADLAYTLCLEGQVEDARALVDRAYRINPDATYLLGAGVNAGILSQDLEYAWRYASRFSFLDSSAYDFFRSQLVLYLRDPDRIRSLMATWPAPGEAAPFHDYFDLMRAIALRELGVAAEERALLDLLQPRIEARLADNPDDDESRKIITAIHGLRGDAENLRRAHAQLMGNPPQDRLWLLEEGFIVIAAQALAGEVDTTLDLVEALVETGGPAQFARVESSPLFDGMRGSARYEALKARYDRWRTTEAVNRS